VRGSADRGLAASALFAAGQDASVPEGSDWALLMAVAEAAEAETDADGGVTADAGAAMASCGKARAASSVAAPMTVMRSRRETPSFMQSTRNRTRHKHRPRM